MSSGPQSQVAVDGQNAQHGQDDTCSLGGNVRPQRHLCEEARKTPYREKRYERRENQKGPLHDISCLAFAPSDQVNASQQWKSINERARRYDVVEILWIMELTGAEGEKSFHDTRPRGAATDGESLPGINQAADG